jgi:hypothetical protein
MHGNGAVEYVGIVFIQAQGTHHHPSTIDQNIEIGNTGRQTIDAILIFDIEL